MKMNNNIKFNEENAVDFELLRIEKLIEEREAYEKAFLSLEPQSDEFEYRISQYEREIETKNLQCLRQDFEEILSDPFDFEDRQNLLRDAMLIKEHLEYEASYDIIVEDFFASNDIYDFQIEVMEKEGFFEEPYDGHVYEYGSEDYSDYVYDPYEEEMFWHLHYLRESQLERPKCSCAYMDYMPHDDGMCDYMDCYDYPEGPEENLNGIRFY